MLFVKFVDDYILLAARITHILSFAFIDIYFCENFFMGDIPT